MIKFDDFFKEITAKGKVKVKFNMNAGNKNYPALDLLLSDDLRWMEMNCWKSKQANNNYSDAEYVLAFAQYYTYGSNYYMFGGLYKIEKIIPEVYDQIGYRLTLQNEFKEYIKRLIIKLDRPVGRDIYNKPFENVQRDFNPEIYELTPSARLSNFNGYNNVLLSHKDLQIIAKYEAPEWKNALENVKGIYIITDISSGKIYIGSATGKSGIWQRWYSYAKGLSGDNKDFANILKKHGEDYIKNNFTYAILEIFDIKTKDDYIIRREHHWMKVFQTIKFGMNN